MLDPQLRVKRVQYHTLMEELREIKNDRRKFKNYTRVSPEMFAPVRGHLIPKFTLLAPFAPIADYFAPLGAT